MILGKLNWTVIVAFCMLAPAGWADSLELRNGSVINGKFMGASENELKFRSGHPFKSTRRPTYFQSTLTPMTWAPTR